MAWRFHENVLRGEIDNSTRGVVTGQVWLSGLEQPLMLDLRGDCHPDLAGCTLRFENPSPIPLPGDPPAYAQFGATGDIMAGRKVRVFDIPVSEALAMMRRGEKPPEHWANSLYLEWYSLLNGRVVIESAEYHLRVSEPSWRFSKEELEERDRQTAEASQDFATVVYASDLPATPEPEWDEARYARLMQESERLGTRHRLLREQYAGHPEADRIIAREMGWTLPEYV